MLAMMVYTGGIYPLPQTVLRVALYSILCAIVDALVAADRLAVGGGLLSVAFSAPRLLPLVDMLRRFPRLVDSPESLGLAALVAVFTSKAARPRPSVGPWGWHEFGDLRRVDADRR